MKSESGKIEGDLVVSEALKLSGMVTGSITVTEMGSLHLHGMCCRDLVIQNGTTAVVFGMVCGNIYNEGTVELRGMVNGNVLSKKGHFQSSPSAVVHGTVET